MDPPAVPKVSHASRALKQVTGRLLFAVMRAPVRPIRGRWPAALERRFGRFFRDSPYALTRDDVTAEQFRKAMSAIHVGETIKITGANRHPVADELLISNVDLTGKVIVDIGASDGSTSVDLIAKLPDFASYVIADLFLSLDVVRSAGHLFFYDADGTCILIAGRRVVAWPSLSKGVGLLYRPMLAIAQRHRGARRELLLLNPATRDLMAQDPRVTYRVHDVFDIWQGRPPDVIKIANLLRRLYFADEEITRALMAVHASLSEDGHLLVVDNPRIVGLGPRAGLYRRMDTGFAIVAETAHRPEISDIVGGFAANNVSPPK
jgi:hypothetical protein